MAKYWAGDIPRRLVVLSLSAKPLTVLIASAKPLTPLTVLIASAAPRLKCFGGKHWIGCVGVASAALRNVGAGGMADL